MRGARYHQGSGGRFLIFRYQVQPVDRDLDGITVSSAAVGRNHNPSRGFSGNIYAKGTDVPIDYVHSGIKDASIHKVNGRPYVMNVGVTSIPPDGWEAYRANQIIEISLNFDIDVVVEGDVGLALYVGLHGSNWAEAWRESVYLRGSGTDTLVFGYAVQPGDMDTRGIMIPYGATAVIGSGNIKAKGADVEYLKHFPTTRASTGSQDRHGSTHYLRHLHHVPAGKQGGLQSRGVHQGRNGLQRTGDQSR